MTNHKHGILFVVAVVALAVGCGVSSRKVGIGGAGKGGTTGGGSSGKSGSGTGGTGTGGKGTGTGGTGASTGGSGASNDGGAGACKQACSGDTPVCNSDGTCGACMNGSASCADGEVPQTCESGAWVQHDPCGGNTPVCSQGTCGPVKLSGSIVTVHDAVLSTGTGASDIRLVRHGLEYTGRICGTVQKRQVCVTGGIQP